MPKTKSPRRAGLRSSTPPFGTPDGANANLQDLLDDFVEFEHRAPDDALVASAADHSTRIIVGKMGVGKTVYVRRFQAAAAEEDSLYADSVRQDVPPTEDVINVAQQFRAPVVEEVWAKIWRRAMVRSALSHILCHHSLRNRPEAEELSSIAAVYRHIVPVGRAPRSIYTEAADIISEHRTRQQIRGYVEHKDWPDLEWNVSEALKTLPPLCFYLDAVDKNFSAAPMYWLKCQKGLVTQVLGLMQEDGFRRLHIVACVRDIVLSSILRGEQAGRYRNEPHIRVLDWDYPAIRHFLREKIRRLPSEYLLKPNADDPVESWLGKRFLHNARRQTDEKIEDYLLRHTRLIPRDVVLVGNLLARGTAECKQQGVSELSDEKIQRVVNQAARGFADQQLEVCANQVAADMIPERGSHHGSAAFYVGSDEYARGVAGELRRLIAELGTDRVTYEELTAALAKTGGELARHGHTLDVLWQHGLLGYDSEEAASAHVHLSHVHFYAATEVDDFNVPEGRDTYVLHPCVAHRIELKPVGPPVRGYRAN